MKLIKEATMQALIPPTDSHATNTKMANTSALLSSLSSSSSFSTSSSLGSSSSSFSSKSSPPFPPPPQPPPPSPPPPNSSIIVFLSLAWTRKCQKPKVTSTIGISIRTSLWIFFGIGCLLSVVEAVGNNMSEIDPSFSSHVSETVRPLDESFVNESATLPVSPRHASLEEDPVLSSTTKSTAENTPNTNPPPSITDIDGLSSEIHVQQLPASSIVSIMNSSFSFVSSDRVFQAASALSVTDANTQALSDTNLVLQSSTHDVIEQAILTSSILKVHSETQSNYNVLLLSASSERVSDFIPTPISDIASTKLHFEQQTAIVENLSSYSNFDESLPSNTLQLGSEDAQPVSQTSSRVESRIDNVSESLYTGDVHNISASPTESTQTGETPSSQELLADSVKVQTDVISLDSSTEFSGIKVQSEVTSMPLLPSFSRSESIVLPENSRSELALSEFYHSSSLTIRKSSYDGFVSSRISVTDFSRSEISTFNRSMSPLDVSDLLTQTRSNSMSSAGVETPLSTDADATILPSRVLQTDLMSTITPIVVSETKLLEDASVRIDDTIVPMSFDSIENQRSNNAFIERPETLTVTASLTISESGNYSSSSSEVLHSSQQSLHDQSTTHFVSTSSLQSQSINLQSVPFHNNSSISMGESVPPHSRMNSDNAEVIESTSIVPTLQSQATVKSESINNGDNAIESSSQGQSFDQKMTSMESEPNKTSDTFIDETSIPSINFNSLDTSIRSNASQQNMNPPDLEHSTILISPSIMSTQPVSSQVQESSVDVVQISTSMFENTISITTPTPSLWSIKGHSISTVQPSPSSIEAVVSNNTGDDSVVVMKTSMSHNQSVNELPTAVETSMSPLVSTTLYSIFNSPEENNSARDNSSSDAISEYMRTFLSSIEITSSRSVNSDTLLGESELSLHSTSPFSLREDLISSAEINSTATASNLLGEPQLSDLLSIKPTSILSSSEISQRSAEIMIDMSQSTNILTNSVPNSNDYATSIDYGTENSMATQTLRKTILPESSLTDTSPHFTDNNETVSALNSSSVGMSLSDTIEISVTPLSMEQSSLTESSLTHSSLNFSFFDEIVHNSLVSVSNEPLPNISGESMIQTSMQMSQNGITPTVLWSNRTMDGSMETISNTSGVTIISHYQTIPITSKSIYSSFSALSGSYQFSFETPSISMSILHTLDSNSNLLSTINEDTNTTELSSIKSTLDYMNSTVALVSESIVEQIQLSRFENSSFLGYNTDMRLSTSSVFEAPDSVSPSSSSSWKASTADDGLQQNLTTDGGAYTSQVGVSTVTQSLVVSQSIEPSMIATHLLELSSFLSTESTTNISEINTPNLNMLSQSIGEDGNANNVTTFPFSEIQSTMSYEANIGSSDVLGLSRAEQDSVVFTEAFHSTLDFRNSSLLSIGTKPSISEQYFDSSSEYILSSSYFPQNISSTIDSSLQPTTTMSQENVTFAWESSNEPHNSSEPVFESQDLISMTEEENFTPSVVDLTPSGVDTNIWEITSSSNVEMLDSTPTTSNRSFSPADAETKIDQFNFSSTFKGVIEISPTEGSVTPLFDLEMSTIEGNINSTIELMPSSRAEDNSTTAILYSDLLQTAENSIVPLSNTTIFPTPPASVSATNINLTNSLDVSQSLSVSLIDFNSTRFPNASQVSSIEQGFLFSTIIDEDASLAASVLESSMGNGTIVDLAQTEIPPTLHDSNSLVMTATMSAEANDTNSIISSAFDFVLSSIQSDNVQESIFESVNLISTAEPESITNASSSPIVPSITNETASLALSQTTMRFNETPNASLDTLNSLSTDTATTISPSPSQTPGSDVSIESLALNSTVTATSTSTTSEQSSDNIISSVDIPGGFSDDETLQSTFPFNSTAEETLLQSSTVPGPALSSTSWTFNASTPIVDIAPSSHVFVLSETSLLSPSTVNHTLFQSDSGLNSISVASLGLVTPTITDATFFQSSSIYMPDSTTLNFSSYITTNLASVDLVVNSTSSTTFMSQTLFLTRVTSMELNALSSLSLVSLNDTSISTLYQELSSTPTRESIIASSQTDEISSQSPFSSLDLSHMNTSITFSPSLDASNISVTQSSNDITPNQTTTLFAAHDTSRSINATLNFDSTVSYNAANDMSSVGYENASPVSFSGISLSSINSPTPMSTTNRFSSYSDSRSAIDDFSSQSNASEETVTVFPTPPLSSTFLDTAPNASMPDLSSLNNETSTAQIPSSIQISQTQSDYPLLTSAELFITETSSPSITASLSFVESDLENSTIASSSSLYTDVAETPSILNSVTDNTVISLTFSPTPPLLSSDLDTSSKFSISVEVSEPSGTERNVTSEPDTPAPSSSIAETSLVSLTTVVSLSPSTEISENFDTGQASSESSSVVSSIPSPSMISLESSAKPSAFEQTTSSSSVTSSLSLSPSSFSSQLPSSSSLPEPTSSPTPSGSTLPTIDNSGHLQSYWVTVGLLIRRSVDVASPQFKLEIEQGLANAYALGRQRQEEINNGTFEPLGKKKRRRRRSVTATADPNVQVEVQAIKREADTTDVEVSHVLQQDGTLVPAEDAVKQMALLNNMELAIQLNQVVEQGPKPYITPASSSDDDDTTVLIAGSAAGAVAAIIIILVIIFCCCCGGNRCCVKRTSREFRISDLAEKSQVVPTTAAENPSYYVDDESQGNTTISITSKKGKYTLADNEEEMNDSGKRAGRPMPARRPPSGEKSAVEQHHVTSAGNEDAERRASPKKRKGKKKKEMDTDEAMEMRSIYESQIASLQESPTHTQVPQALSPVDLVITGPPTVEMEEDLLENAEEERRKNKQRLREKRRKEKEHESPVKTQQDDVHVVYESAQKEIDKVLGPRKDAEKPRKKSKDKKKKKEKSDESGDNSQEEEGPPPDTLEEARVKIHRLLDDAFSLMSQSRSSMGNKVHPISQQSSFDKGSPRSQHSHRSHSSMDHADQDVQDQSVPEKKHTPLYVERTHDAYDRSGLISWSPYRASDDTAMISLPNTQTNLNSVAPQREPIKGTTVFSESLPSSLQPHYYTTLPGEPIVLRTKDLDANHQAPNPHHHYHHHHSGGGESISVKSNHKPAAVIDTEDKGRGNGDNADDLYIPYYGMSSYHELPPSTAIPNSSNTSPGEDYYNRRNSSSNNRDYFPNGDVSSNNNNNDNNVNSVNGGVLKMHSAPGRGGGGGERDGKDFVDVIKHSVQPGASPQPLIHSLREELLNLSRKKGGIPSSSSDSHNVSGKSENGGLEKPSMSSSSSKTDRKPPSGVTSLGQDSYYRNNRNGHMKTDL